MDKQLIHEKLESLRKCVARIQSKCPKIPDKLHSDPDLQDIISVNLIRAVQISVDIAAHIISSSESDIPSTMGDMFTTLYKLGVLDQKISTSMRNSVGFRNIATHNYDEIDWDIVYAICSEHLNDFKSYAAAMDKQLERL